jgi:hypothetical protein
MPEDAPFESGFNIKTLWAALFVGFVMLPGSIYLGLMTGSPMAGAAEWVTIILFIEMTRRSFGKLKTQEIIILYWVSGGLIMAAGKLGSGQPLFGGPFGPKIWDQYLIQSPQAIGLAEHIPTWLVPALGSEALEKRSFWDVAWLIPMLVVFANMVLMRVISLSLGYALFRVTHDIEKLPFPMARVYAGGATALAESSAKQETWRWRVFSTGSFIGVIWGFIYVVVPALSGIFLTQTITILPIPFVDFTPAIRSMLPAAILGLGTNIAMVLTGFVLPFWVVVGNFIGAMVKSLIANPILYHLGYLQRWTPGMTTIPTTVSNSLDFWLSFGIGPAVLVGLLGFGMAGTAMWKRYQAARAGTAEVVPRELPAGRGDIKISTALAIWLAGTIGSVILVRVLVPDFPWWICAIFGLIWTPYSSYVGARMIGLTGRAFGASFPYLREASFYLSGYKGAKVWFAPIPMLGVGGTAQMFKQLELTKCRFGSAVKLSILTLFIMFVCSFLFWSLIWRLGPIPSSAYPYVQRMWPMGAMMQCLWVKSTLPPAGDPTLFASYFNAAGRASEAAVPHLLGPVLGKYFTGGTLLREVLKPDIIVTGGIVATVLYVLMTLAGLPRLLFYGLVSGVGWWPHWAIPQFFGAMLGRYYIGKRLGQQRWRAYAPILAAGYGCGFGLIGMISIAIVLISKAVSTIVI